MTGSELVLAILVGVGALIGATVAASWVFARLWCRPRRLPHSRSPADVGLPFEEVSFPSHGVELAGWFVPASAGEAPWAAVVLIHGWSSNAGELLSLARVLHGTGIACLLFDARGHGASGGDGPITILKFTEDALAAVAYLRTRRDVDIARLGVLGRSIGGGAALLAASMERLIGAVASLSAFADPHQLTLTTLRRLHVPAWPVGSLVCRFIEGWLGARMHTVAPVRRIGRITAPILLIHGDADAFIPPANLEALWVNAPKPAARRLLAAGRGHSDVARSAGVRREVAAFFAGHLGVSADTAAPPIEPRDATRPAAARASGDLESCCGRPLTGAWQAALCGAMRERWLRSAPQPPRPGTGHITEQA